MCASKINEDILKEAAEVARLKGFSNINEFLRQTIKESLSTEKKWRSGHLGKRKRLGKARIVSDAP